MNKIICLLFIISIVIAQQHDAAAAADKGKTGAQPTTTTAGKTDPKAGSTPATTGTSGNSTDGKPATNGKPNDGKPAAGTPNDGKPATNGKPNDGKPAAGNDSNQAKFESCVTDKCKKELSECTSSKTCPTTIKTCAGAIKKGDPEGKKKLEKCLGDDKDKKALPFIQCAGKCNNNGKKSDYLDMFFKN